MPSNEVTVAAAGSGKTTFVVRQVLEGSGHVAVVTYTHNNTNGLVEKFFQNGGLPTRVHVSPWFTFVLRQMIRPYQSYVRPQRIRTVAWISGISAKQVRKSNTDKYFFTRGGDIYSDKIAECALMCDEKSNGLVMKRLGALYDRVYVDEVQDLVGYELDLVERMMSAGVAVTLVGDPRQFTYPTHQTRKNKKYRGVRIVDKFSEWESKGLCHVSTLDSSYRCNQAICDLADSLYPSMPPTVSLNSHESGHDGVFIVRPDQVSRYVAEFRPQVLRYNKSSRCGGNAAMNFGASKGLEFPRVLIYPHGPLSKLIKTGDLKHVEKSLAKVYVAVTRARHSVAFVHVGKFAMKASVYR